MAITQAEVAASGISSDDFSSITNSPSGFLRKLVVQRYNPVFSTHDSNINTAFQFSVAANDTKIVRAISDSANLSADTLNVESDNQASPNTWTSPVTIEALASPSTINVKCVRQSSSWDIFFQRSTGKIGRANSTDGISWSVSDFNSHALPLDGTLEWIAYGGGSIEMIYYMTTTSQNSHWLRAMDTSGNVYDTGIYWHEQMLGMDCEEIIDNNTDSTGDITGENVRHILTFSATLPGYFTYQNSSGVPAQYFIESGGIIAFVVRPPVTGSYRPVMVGQHHIVRGFDRVSTINYRRTVHMTPMNSIFDASNNRDMLWLACYGEDGDFNTTDTSIGYQALYYYNSRDGINWSQDRIVPLDGIPNLDHYPTGVQVIKCGHYIYLISVNTTLRSPLPAEFGPVVHPDLEIDVTSFITQYSSSQADMRNTQIVLDNRDSRFSATFLGQPGAFALITSIGQHVSGVDYLFQVAIEHVDSIQFQRQRGTDTTQERLVIQSRDRMSWLTDKSQSPDAIQYDNQIVGMDDFAPLDTTLADSGLAHTAVVKGSFATVSHMLHLTSKYKEGVAFNTFATSIADGAIDTTFWLPNPSTRDTSGVTINATNTPTYAGIVYRAIDKDNLWYVYYDFFLESFNIGYRVGGSDVSLGLYDPGSWFNGQATTENFMTMHVEFRYSKIKLWVKLADGKLHNLVDQLLPGQGPGFTPFMQGYVGVIGSGWSDEDQSADEPGPTIIVTPDSGTIDDLSPFTDVGTSDPSAPSDPPSGSVLKLGGESVWSGSSSTTHWLKNFISLTTPTPITNTPGSFSGWAIQAVLVQPVPSGPTAAGYVLAYNSGTGKSAVWYAPNIWYGSPSWSKGADVSGKYNIIRATNVPGEIVIEGVLDVTQSYTEDFATGLHSKTHYQPYAGLYLVFNSAAGTFQSHDGRGGAGDGCVTKVFIGNDGSGNDYYGAIVVIDFGYEVNISHIEWYGYQHIEHTDYYTLPYSAEGVYLGDGGPSFHNNIGGGAVDVWHILPDWSVNGVRYVILGLVRAIATGDDPGEVKIDDILIDYDEHIATETRTSSDNGATFSAAVDVGNTTTSTGSGFDVTKNSATNYASCDNKVRKATSLGGAFSDFVSFTGATPACVIIPYYRRGSDTADQTALADPDFIAALNTADSDGGTLYWVNGTTGAKANITPVAGITFDNPNCVTTHYGTHIAVFGKVSGVYKLYTSEDAGATWHFVKNLTAPHFIRGRRTNPYTGRGQIYLADNGSMWYSSHWGEMGMFIRNMPDSIITFDTVW